MTERLVKHSCGRCGHSPDDHRFDDDRANELADVPWERRPFRCVGPHLRGCAGACPDFIGQPYTLLETV